MSFPKVNRLWPVTQVPGSSATFWGLSPISYLSYYLFICLFGWPHGRCRPIWGVAVVEDAVSRRHFFVDKTRGWPLKEWKEKKHKANRKDAKCIQNCLFVSWFFFYFFLSILSMLECRIACFIFRSCRRSCLIDTFFDF